MTESDSPYQRLDSRPCATASWTAPARIATSAQTVWASMCRVEFVKKTATGQSSTPSANASDGQT